MGVCVLRSIPSEPKDYNTARCRIAPKVMKTIGAIIGSPIRIKLKSCYVLCSAWPRVEGTDDMIQFDTFISRQTNSERTKRTAKECPRYETLTIPADICVLRPIEAKTVVISLYVSSTEDGDLNPSLPKALQKARDERRMCVLLKNHTVAVGCCIRPRKSRNNPNRFLEGIEKVVVESTECASCSDVEDNSFVTVTGRTKVVVNSVKRFSSEGDESRFVLAGLDSAAQMLQELIQYPFLYSESFAHLRLECPKGVLLQGAPGVGKTLLVRAVTSQCSAWLVTLNATDVFGPHSGESEENLRKVFERARYLYILEQFRWKGGVGWGVVSRPRHFRLL